MTLTDILGNDDAAFMSNSRRNCRPPTGATPQQIRFIADQWFPGDGGERVAQTLCHGCPVIAECRAWAIPQVELSGVWGGTTTAMRIKARRNAKDRQRRGSAA
jgi:hypothetical protein